jgi:hypothetical protein
MKKKKVIVRKAVIRKMRKQRLRWCGKVKRMVVDRWLKKYLSSPQRRPKKRLPQQR